MNREKLERSKAIRNMKIAGKALVITGAAYGLLMVLSFKALIASYMGLDPKVDLLVTAITVVAGFLLNYIAQRWVGASIAFPVFFEKDAGHIAGWPVVGLCNATNELTEVKVVFEVYKDHNGTDVFVHSEVIQIGGMLSKGRKSKHDEMLILIPQTIVDLGKVDGYTAMATVNYVHQFTNFRAFRRKEIPRQHLQTTATKPEYDFTKKKLPPSE